MPGLMRGVARTAVVAGTATAVSNRVSRRQANKWNSQADAEAYQAQQAQQAQAQAYAPPPQAYAPPPPPPPPAVSTDHKLAQLKELAALKEAGILTDAEFEAQKAKILAS